LSAARLISILVPAYNEEQTIAEALRRIAAVDVRGLGFEKEILVCDDGSRDRTFAEIERVRAELPELRVLRSARNRGKGAAIRTALAEARGEYSLVQDADLEYRVEDYSAMLAPIAGGAEVVYGSRFRARAWPSGMRPANLVANKLLTALANALYGVAITDEATCLKLVRTELLRSLELECTRFEFCPEVTAKVGLRGVPIVEVPVSYEARPPRDGKKVGWRDGAAAVWTLVSLRLRGR
jgi:hypothetical protein